MRKKDDERNLKEYGYNDPELVRDPGLSGGKKFIGFLLAILFITGVWLALNQKLLFGEEWLSPTYDNVDWRTNEGNLPTYGAWDLETHIWKTEYILKYFPDFQWNPFWYLGMPLLKYYQLGFYALTIGAMKIFGLGAARAGLLLTIFGHLLATLLTFLLCYKMSRRIFVSAMCSIFLLANTFISLRSYGWEPITVVFLFLYPLGLLLFFREPMRPLRLSVILVMAVAYLSHPLLWFSLIMTMGLYLLYIALGKDFRTKRAANSHYIWQLMLVVLCSILLGAVQFLPQFSYEQVTSGAHMGVTYLPYYQVPYNIITLKNFFFDAGNLKGPGPIIMITFFLLILFYIIESYMDVDKEKKFYNHKILAGLGLALFTMVSFYYLELYNIFPMNFLRSIQYHRIIPEFIITAAATVAVMSNTIKTQAQKIMYYSMIIGFVLASGLIIHDVQGHWQTSSDISSRPEFIYDENLTGRISMPYTDQSLSVRNSFTEIPQVYGYYEQGITSAYADELFSVSSGFHNSELTVLYLKAANVERLYVNTNAGERDFITRTRLNSTLEFYHNGTSRYGYFQVPLYDPSFAQAVSHSGAEGLKDSAMGCRELFQEDYCGSQKEEFVGKDEAEVNYLRNYVMLLETSHPADADMEMLDPDHYRISVTGADRNTDIIVKMNYDEDFVVTVDGDRIGIERIGPDFMRLMPNRAGDYEIMLEYKTSNVVLIGAAITASFAVIILFVFLFKRFLRVPSFIRKRFKFEQGDM